jgi:aspartate ammonia-lyase
MRKERDSFGMAMVPSEAYYGIFTQRAMGNFPISRLRLQMELIKAYAQIKRAAAVSNIKAGRLGGKIGSAIVRASEEVIDSKPGSRLWDQFPVDVFQAGAGTSTNMNLNEVIANRALEILGKKRGDYKAINPNDHVNMSQSTNDTFHDAIHIAAYVQVQERLIPALMGYERAVKKKARSFSRIVKLGRTHLMDAVPITLGQEFSGYSIASEMELMGHSARGLSFLSLGGTAVGTGINTDPDFAGIALTALNSHLGHGFRISPNRFSYMQNLSAIAEASGALKVLALRFIKIANDLRFLSSGPNSGIGEITLPAVQPGSSIMPGKVNPSIPEMLDMVCFKVIGNDLTVSLAAQNGQLDLNVFGPVAAYSLLESLEIMANGVGIFTNKCILGIKPNVKRIAFNLSRSAEIATVLAPMLGYGVASEIIEEAVRKGVDIKELILKRKILTRKELDSAFEPMALTKPNLNRKKADGV